jgi:Translation initiation factor IF-2, N-terminal region
LTNVTSRRSSTNYIEVKELADLIGLKAFKVVADVLALGILKYANELIDFSTAAAIARKHGFTVKKAP